MQTRPLPETPGARSPAGAEIRYLMGGTTGDMIHSTVPPGQVNPATVHAMIDAYRGSGAATWNRIEIDVRELGEHAVFATVRWNALDSEGNVLRDTRTTYHLLSTSDGWRLLSYTNHF